MHFIQFMKNISTKSTSAEFGNIPRRLPQRYFIVIEQKHRF